LNDNINEFISISDDISKGRECLNFLIEKKFITDEEKTKFEKRIDAYEKDSFLFSTKTFRSCHSMEKTLYNFMFALSQRFQKSLLGNKDENKSP
jgi:hypothetical protein